MIFGERFCRKESIELLPLNRNSPDIRMPSSSGTPRCSSQVDVAGVHLVAAAPKISCRLELLTAGPTSNPGGIMFTSSRRHTPAVRLAGRPMFVLESRQVFTAGTLPLTTGSSIRPCDLTTGNRWDSCPQFLSLTCDQKRENMRLQKEDLYGSPTRSFVRLYPS